MGVPDLFRAPPRLPLIAPSILSADFAAMGVECASVLKGGADLLHLDVMDGHFVPNLTMGPDMCRALRRAFPSVFLDVHLMVTDPGRFVEPFADAGANHITFHVEAVGGADARALATRVRNLGLSVGLALNPPTRFDIAGPIVDAFDLILVMSVNPGYAGQAFMEGVLGKTREVRRAVGLGVRVQMDGGIGVGQARAVRQAGCDVLVAASAVFGRPPEERPMVIEALRFG
jgi:ribulose-phosphate 3-epimerase